MPTYTDIITAVTTEGATYLPFIVASLIIGLIVFFVRRFVMMGR